MQLQVFSRHRSIVAGLLALAGALTAIAMIIGLRATGSQLLSGGELQVLLAAPVGAFLAGAVTAPAFGHAGGKGWMMAALGAVIATAAGAFIAGLLLFQDGTLALYCTLMLAVTMYEVPQVGLIWVALMATVQASALVLVAKVPARLDLIPGPDNL